MTMKARVRADGAFFDDVHRGDEGASAQGRSEFLRARERGDAGDLEAVGKLALDGGGVHHGFVFFDGGDRVAVFVVFGDGDVFDIDGRHRFFQVLAGDLRHLRATGGVKDDVHRDALLACRVYGGVYDVFAAQHDFALEEDGRAVFKVGEFAAKGRAFHAYRLGEVALFVHDVEFERGGGAEHFFGFGDVLDARQLDEEAVVTDDLNRGFGNAEAVHPAGHALAVLVGGAAFEFADALFAVLQADAVLAVFFEVHLFEAWRQQGAQFVQRAFAVAVAGKAEDDAAVLGGFCTLHRDVVFFGGGGGDVNQLCRFAREQFVAVNLQEEGDTAAQVKAEVHRREAHGLQPLRRVRQEVYRDGVVRVFAGEQVARLDLYVGLREEEVEVLAVHFPAARLDAGGVQLCGDFLCRCGGGFRRGKLHLHGRAFAEPVGQREQRTQ